VRKVVRMVKNGPHEKGEEKKGTGKEDSQCKEGQGYVWNKKGTGKEDSAKKDEDMCGTKWQKCCMASGQCKEGQGYDSAKKGKDMCGNWQGGRAKKGGKICGTKDGRRCCMADVGRCLWPMWSYVICHQGWSRGWWMEAGGVFIP
jgi:hypothetical protein